jgi:hypothetical protein
METESRKWFYKSYWLVDKRVAFLEIIGDFDEAGMIEFNTHLRDEYLEKGERPIHCIIDAAGLTGYPRNIGTLRRGTSISVNHPNIGWVVLVGFDNPLVKFLASAVVQILGIKFKQVESLAEAREILSRVDTRLTTSI